MKKFIVVITLGLLIVSLGAIFNVIKNNITDPASTAIPENIELKELASNENIKINFSEKPTVLLFFTSWCPYCNEDAPKIVSLHKKFKNKMNIYGINPTFRDDLSDVKNYVENYNITYPILLDDTGDTYKIFGESGFPSLYFINSKAEVIDQIIGSTDLEEIEKSFKYLEENFNS